MQGNHLFSLENSQNIFATLSFPLQNHPEVVEDQNQEEMKLYEFQESGMGIIFVKQNYVKLLYEKTLNLELPVEGIILLFYESQKSKQPWLMSLKLTRNKLVFDIAKKFKTVQQIQSQRYPITLQFSQPLFPSPEQARLFLQKKIWLQINKLVKNIKLSIGDIKNFGEGTLFNHDFDHEDQQKNSWKTQVDSYYMPGISQQSSNKKINILQKIKYFRVGIKIAKNGVKQTTQNISDFITIQLLKEGKLYDQIVQKNPSLLSTSVANIESMPKPLKILHNLLEQFDLKKLPILTSDRGEKVGWKNLQYSIHHSLTTKYGLTENGKPRGVLNHLYKMKLKKKYQQLILTRDGPTKFKTKSDLLNSIYSHRSGYIRLELLPHQGMSPGSMAVLQIWPPYHCSSIHNHGDSYGLIKVLSGSIFVQNFSELTFNEMKPYDENTFTEDQYTWLSEYSFGIHRLINLQPQACLTLQTYYRNQGSKQFFSVVTKNQVYKQYFPQNDWKNYLELIYDENTLHEDRQFIQNIIKTYNLEEYKQINSSFEKLCMILKDEYEFALNFDLDDKIHQSSISKLDNKNLIIWISNNKHQLQKIKKSYFECKTFSHIIKTCSEVQSQAFKQNLTMIKKNNSYNSILIVYDVDKKQDEQNFDKKISDSFNLIDRWFYHKQGEQIKRDYFIYCYRTQYNYLKNSIFLDQKFNIFTSLKSLIELLQSKISYSY